MSNAAIQQLESADSSLEELARAGSVLSQLGSLENKHKTSACQNVKLATDMSIKDSYHAVELYNLFACPSLKASTKDTASKVKNSANYKGASDYWYGLQYANNYGNSADLYD